MQSSNKSAHGIFEAIALSVSVGPYGYSIIYKLLPPKCYCLKQKKNCVGNLCEKMEGFVFTSHTLWRLMLKNNRELNIYCTYKLTILVLIKLCVFYCWHSILHFIMINYFINAINLVVWPRLFASFKITFSTKQTKTHKFRFHCILKKLH